MGMRRRAVTADVMEMGMTRVLPRAGSLDEHPVDRALAAFLILGVDRLPGSLLERLVDPSGRRRPLRQILAPGPDDCYHVSDVARAAGTPWAPKPPSLLTEILDVAVASGLLSIRCEALKIALEPVRPALGSLSLAEFADVLSLHGLTSLRLVRRSEVRWVLRRYRRPT